MHYRPADPLVYPRFEGVRTFMRLPHVQELDGVDAAIVGIPFDTATSFRPGARFGPEAIRSASVLLRPYHGRHELDIFEQLSVVDYGDLPVVPGNAERTFEQVAEGLRPLVDAGVLPLVLGGDHSITLAVLRALVKTHGPLALLQFDSHSDTGDTYFGERYSHGTTFRRAVEEGLLVADSSAQVGLRGSLYSSGDLPAAEALGFRIITADELRVLGPEGLPQELCGRIGSHPLFVSFDIDFADPAYAPGTGTPEIGGFTSAEVVAFLRGFPESVLVGFDLVEVSPAYDSAGQPTAILAANIVWEVLGLAARSARAAGGSDPTGHS
jgi:agmatinase